MIKENTFYLTIEEMELGLSARQPGQLLQISFVKQQASSQGLATTRGHLSSEYTVIQSTTNHQIRQKNESFCRLINQYRLINS